ncbi:MAG: hypothetical protein K2X09_05290 [Rickettsiales bacterium]|nr:hypothetical protein [Rickettsiales bacterium]
MLAALFGAIAGIAQKASEVTEDLGRRVGLPEWVTGGISGAFSAVGNVSESAQDIQLPGIGNPLMAMREGAKNFIGGFTTEKELPAPGQKYGRTADDLAYVAAMEFQPKPQNFHSLGDLGQLERQFSNVAVQRPVNAVGAGASV